MNWIIILLIAFVTMVFVFSICGAGGGMMLLVALNGFSESAATPFIIIFALIVIGGSIAISTAASWIVIKKRGADTTIRLWHVIGIASGVNVLTILLITAVIVLRNFF